MIKSWLTSIVSGIVGPFSRVAETWVKVKADVDLKELENDGRRDLYSKEVKQAVLADNAKTNQLVSNILKEDASKTATSWVRPVSVGLSMAFWVILAGSQMIYTPGNGQLIPITFNFPPGEYGELLMYFPMGVIGTFILLRPAEKISMILKGRI